MLKIEYPANAIYLSTVISKLINLDVLDPDLIGKILMDYSLYDAIYEDPNYVLEEGNTKILIP